MTKTTAPAAAKTLRSIEQALLERLARTAADPKADVKEINSLLDAVGRTRDLRPDATPGEPASEADLPPLDAAEGAAA